MFTTRRGKEDTGRRSQDRDRRSCPQQIRKNDILGTGKQEANTMIQRVF